MRVRHKPWAQDFLNNAPFVVMFNEQQTNGFDVKHNNIWLEVGVGKGHFFATMAAKHPDIFFVGIELNPNIAALAAKKVAELNLNNTQLFVGDAQEVLRVFPAKTFKRVILNHSDPWPKKRHAKRRLSHPKFLNLYKQVLKDDGELVFKTDNFNFAHYTLEMLVQEHFKVTHFELDYDGKNTFDAMTEYEQNFRQKGVPIKFISAKKE